MNFQAYILYCQSSEPKAPKRVLWPLIMGPVAMRCYLPRTRSLLSHPHPPLQKNTSFPLRMSAEDDELPRLETIAEILRPQEAEAVPPLRGPGYCRKRKNSVVHRPGLEVSLRLRLRGLLKDLCDNAPRVLQGPLDRAMADIDGCIAPDVWVSRKMRGFLPNGRVEPIPSDGLKELEDLKGLLSLVTDMQKCARKEQMEILERLSVDVNHLILNRESFWKCHLGTARIIF